MVDFAMLQEVRFMARNIDYGNEENLVPFNCYKSFINDKGRLIRDSIVYERIYCKIENQKFACPKSSLLFDFFG